MVMRVNSSSFENLRQQYDTREVSYELLFLLKDVFVYSYYQKNTNAPLKSQSTRNIKVTSSIPEIL